jgi:gamma-glutamylcyclotransferase (GGCT)/AIG2-like uncharacterized protein YtfP
MRSKLKALENEIKIGAYEFGNELWAGADVVVIFPDDERARRYSEKGDIVVQSKHANKIGSIFFSLKEIFSKHIDYYSKYEFYGRLAESANSYINSSGDSENVVFALIKEAEKMLSLNPEQQVYFAYGSNMDQDQMGARCPNSKMLGNAVLPGYRFAIDSSGFATVMPEPSSEVEGVLWLITDSDEQNLDRYEGVKKSCYKKARYSVKYGDELISALCYVSLRDSGEKARPGYMERVVKAAKDVALTEKYCALLNQFLPRSDAIRKK